MSGKLYLVPTPIGNLEDISYRAVRILSEVDLILAEDTRQSAKLLNHYEIDNKMRPFHQHNEHRELERVVAQIEGGMQIAAISDAGTPGISDPGFLLARACLEKGIAIEALPGPTAFIPALLKSGLPIHRFCFEGFLPHKKGRQTRILALENEERTAVFYESPHRLLKTLKQMRELLGERRGSVSRELSKLHEETLNGSLDELISHFSEHPPKGEIVLVIGPA